MPNKLPRRKRRGINLSFIPGSDSSRRSAYLIGYPEKTGRFWIPDQVGYDIATDTRPEGDFEPQAIYPNREQ